MNLAEFAVACLAALLVYLVVAWDWIRRRTRPIERAYDTAYPITTWQQVIDTLPARVADMIEASSPCPRGGGRHIWKPVMHQIEQFGTTRYVRSDEFWRCESCGAAIDDYMLREL